MKHLDPLELDVRPLLAEGVEPFPRIRQAMDALAIGQSLVLRAPFEPKPLYAVFGERGYDARSTQLEGGAWEVVFTPKAAQASGLELDLRDLPPPEPLQQALESLSRLGREDVLTLHTRFRPIHLEDQLPVRGFDCDSEECGPDHWETRIWRIIQP